MQAASPPSIGPVQMLLSSIGAISLVIVFTVLLQRSKLMTCVVIF